MCYEASNLGSDPEEYDDEDSSEEAPDGPFNMITETYYEDEDYDLWTPVSSLMNFIKTLKKWKTFSWKILDSYFSHA